MASYAGIDLGLIEAASDGPLPVEFQRNAYPGVDGVEQLAMGSRGWSFQLAGVIVGGDLATFVAIKSALFAAQASGAADTYVDADGYARSGVVLVGFRPAGPRYRVDAVGPAVAQRYSAEFFYPGP